MNSEERRRRRMSIAWTVITAVVVSAVAFIIGLSIPLSLLIAVSIVAGGAILTLIDVSQDAVWSNAKVSLRTGARSEISRLSWSLPTYRGRVSEAAAYRLRSFAVGRLALRGIDLDDPDQGPEAEAALGSLAYRVFTSPSTQSVDTILRCVRALDELDDRNSRDEFGIVPTSVPSATRRPA